MSELINSIDISQNLGFTKLDDDAAAAISGGTLVLGDDYKDFFSLSATLEMSVGDTVCFDELGLSNKVSYASAFHPTSLLDPSIGDASYEFKDNETGKTKILTAKAETIGSTMLLEGKVDDNIYDTVTRLS